MFKLLKMISMVAGFRDHYIREGDEEMVSLSEDLLKLLLITAYDSCEEGEKDDK